MIVLSKPKKIILGVFALVILAVAGYVAMRLLGPAIVIRGKEVTRQEYSELKGKYALFAKNRNQPEGDLDAKTADSLILEAGLENEAANRNIKVTPEDVDKAYLEDVKTYGGSESEYEAMLMATYGWTVKDVKRELKIKLYKEKLLSHLIGGRDVFGAYIRWDLDPGYDAEAQAKYEKEFSPKFDEGATNEQIRNERERIAKDPKWGGAVSGILIFGGVNSETAKTTFLYGDDEWSNIKKLNNIGEQTGLIRSSGGYFVRYRLTGITHGAYTSWEDFVTQIKKEKGTKLNTFGSDAVRLKISANNAASWLQGLFRVKSALAITCSTNHMGIFWGRTVDGPTQQSLSVRFVFNRGADKPGDAFSGPECGSATNSPQTSNNRFDLGNPGSSYTSSSSLSCLWLWNITASADGYYNVSWTNADLGANGSSLQLNNAAATGYATYYKSQNNSGGTSQGTKPTSDPYVWMYPLPKAHYVSPAPDTKYVNDPGTDIVVTFEAYATGPSSRTFQIAYKFGAGSDSYGLPLLYGALQAGGSGNTHRRSLVLQSNPTNTAWRWKWAGPGDYGNWINEPLTGKSFYWVGYVKDSDGVQGIDTCATAGGTCRRFQIVATKDLVAESLAYSPSSAVEGSNMTFSATIRNAGGSSAEASQTRLRLDINNDGTWDVTPANQPTSALSPNASESETWANAWEALAGTHKYEVCADAANNVGESNENNNCTTATFTVATSHIYSIDVGSTSGTNYKPGQIVNLFVQGRNIGGAVGPTATIEAFNAVSGAANFETLSTPFDSLRSVSGDHYLWNNNIPSIAANSNSAVYYYSYKIKDSTPEGEYCFNATIAPRSSIDSGPSNSTGYPRSYCIVVGKPFLPFVSTSAGSVHSGGNIVQPSGSCSPGAGNITGRTSATTGSLSEYVTSAGNNINQFGSAGSVLSPGALGLVQYGKVCRPDLVAAARTYTPTATYNSSTGLFNIASGLMLTGGAHTKVKSGIVNSRITLFIDGDAYIEGNIVYFGGSYLIPSAAPSFGMIVNGNLYIDKSVTTLHGFYYAKGRIDTCYDTVNAPNGTIGASSAFANCNNQLKVNGFLSGSGFNFRRTFGDVGGRNNGAVPSEQVNYSALLYISTPPGFGNLISKPSTAGERPPLY